MSRAITTMLFFCFAALIMPISVLADDTNDILMLNNQDCNNYGDQMQCTGVVADYCCFSAMPFCWVAIYDSADVTASLTAWSNTNSCPIGSGTTSQQCTNGYCNCLDANTAGSNTAACSALWSPTSQEQPPRHYEARSPGAAYSACRPADTLMYTDATTGQKRVIKNITHNNFDEVLDLYTSRRYIELTRFAIPIKD